MVGPFPRMIPFSSVLRSGRLYCSKRTPRFCQFVHGKIDIVHREIENGERRRNVIRLWINDYVIAAGEPQGEQTVRFRNV